MAQQVTEVSETRGVSAFEVPREFQANTTGQEGSSSNAKLCRKQRDLLVGIMQTEQEHA